MPICKQYQAMLGIFFTNALDCRHGDKGIPQLPYPVDEDGLSSAHECVFPLPISSETALRYLLAFDPVNTSMPIGPDIRLRPAAVPK
jgi:hypothetical protein